MKLRKFILVFCTFLFFLLFASGYITLKSFFKKVPALPETYGNPKLNRSEDIKIPKTVSFYTPVNLLILGVDEDGVRSDVMILVNYDPGSNKINMLSIARDTRVYIDGSPGKINSLIGVGGEKLAIAGVEKLTGIRVDYYLTIDFKGFRKIIDVFGGVEVDVPITMCYDDPTQNLHIHLEKGRQKLDGKKAEQFIRFRKGNRNNQGYVDGDLGRIRAQQNLIKELISQKLNLRYLSKADDIFLILKKYVKTNIQFSDINKYINTIKDLKDTDIRTFTSPGESRYINGVWYFLCDIKKTRDIIKKNFISSRIGASPAP